jgi:hypothetical protein
MNQKKAQTRPKSATAIPNPRERAAMASKLQLLNTALADEDSRRFWLASAFREGSYGDPRRCATFFQEGKAVCYSESFVYTEMDAIRIQVPTDLPPATVCAALERIIRKIRKEGVEVFASINKLDRDRADVLRAEFGKPSDPDATPTPF